MARAWAWRPSRLSRPRRLCQRPNAACLGDQVLRVHIGSDLQGLGGDHDQMTPAAQGGVARGRHAVHRVENPTPDPLRLPLPGAAGQKQDFG